MSAKQATPRNYFLIISMLILAFLCIIILVLGGIVAKRIIGGSRLNNPSVYKNTPTLVQEIHPTLTLPISPNSELSQIPASTPILENTQPPAASPTSNPTQTPTISPTSEPTRTPTHTPSPAPTVETGSTWVRPADGMLMLHIPEGKFTMGSSSGNQNEKPAHTVALDDYWIDQTELTNAMFQVFVEATGYTTDAEKVSHSLAYQAGATIPVAQKWKQTPGADWLHPHGPGSTLDGLENHPVVQISWNDATAYGKWAGVRLPTEAEWERAARGFDERIFPWGNQPLDASRANSADVNLDALWSNKTINDGFKFTSPIGNYPAGASPFGALDMAGNTAEWVFDIYRDDFYFNSSISNPTGPASGYVHVLRGGQWSFTANGLRAAARVGQLLTYSSDYSGFRCARTPEE